MPEARHVAPKDGDVLVLAGTVKGAFLFRSNAARTRWDMGGPYFPGQSIYAMALDQRGGGRRLWAGGGAEHWGPLLHSSDDFGKTWTNPEQIPIKFPEGNEAAVKRIWQIETGRKEEPGTLYAGVEPAALFRSRDSGETWSLVEGLWNHPHRAQWQPGGGGLCLHTILPDPASERITIAVSTGGVYRSEDDGDTWQVRNSGVRAEYLPDKHPEFGQCVHKVVHHPSRPERLFLQNHWGLYRSDDAGDSWTDIANGVPSDFGFAMAMHPHDTDTVYIVPIESDMFRCTPEGKLRVYRTRDAGGSWEPLTKGLPQKNALETVLRDAMDVDQLNPAGVYFGTRSGTLWGSSNGGSSWSPVVDGLPAITCVKVAVVGDPSKVRPRAAAGAGRASSPARKTAGSKAAGGHKTAKAKSGTARKAAGRGKTARKAAGRGTATRKAAARGKATRKVAARGKAPRKAAARGKVARKTAGRGARRAKKR